MNDKEMNRKCFKCGCSPANDHVTLYRFPKPGIRNLARYVLQKIWLECDGKGCTRGLGFWRRCELWAKYIFPDRQYSSVEFQTKLHKEHRMLCNKHFKASDYADISKKFLFRHAVPSDHTELLVASPMPAIDQAVTSQDSVDISIVPNPSATTTSCPTSPVLPNVDDETHDNNEQNIEVINEQSDEQTDKQKQANNKNTFKSPIIRKRPREDYETDIQRNIKDTISNLNSILLNRKENDECDLYAQLLATKLREYSKQQRRQIMQGIDELLLANPPQQLQDFDRNTPSPTYSSSSSGRVTPQQSHVQIAIPDPPTSFNTFVLQPQQSLFKISVPCRSTASFVSSPQPVKIFIPYLSSRSSYVLQPQLSGTTTALPSQNCVTALSQEVIQHPDSENNNNTAFKFKRRV